METEGSLPHPQQPVTRPYPEPDHCLVCTEGSPRCRGFYVWFVTWLIVYGEWLLAPRPIPALEGTPCQLSATDSI
jgi:hypothetical protein